MPKGRAKQIAKRIEKRVAQSTPVAPPVQQDPVARIESLLSNFLVGFGAQQKPEPPSFPLLKNKPRTEHDALQEAMGTHRARNREWRDQEVLMSKIGTLESFRDVTDQRIARIERALGLIQ